VIRRVIDDYAAPDRTFDELQQRFRAEEDGDDPLREFGEACRADLRVLRG
jgi:hypothetical protein